MELNLQNIEDLIFFDPKVQALLPECRPLFEQWNLGKRVPGMQTLSKRMAVELLNSLEPDQVRRLEEYFGATILLDKINGSLVKHYEGCLDGSEEQICRFADFKEFAVYRDGDKMYVTYWR